MARKLLSDNRVLMLERVVTDMVEQGRLAPLGTDVLALIRTLRDREERLAEAVRLLRQAWEYSSVVKDIDEVTAFLSRYPEA